MERKDVEANAYMGRFANLMRHLTNQSKDHFATIQSEKELIKNYVLLKNLQFDNPIGIAFEHSNELSKQLIPSFLLQPLIENAIKHGLLP